VSSGPNTDQSCTAFTVNRNFHAVCSTGLLESFIFFANKSDASETNDMIAKHISCKAPNSIDEARGMRDVVDLIDLLTRLF
jgi:hypothetical protein